MLGRGLKGVGILIVACASTWSAQAARVQGQVGATISGSVVDGVSGRPLEGSIVYLGVEGPGPVGQVPRLIADAQGRFVFRNLPPSDRYFIRASRSGYFDGVYGGQNPFDLGRRIVLQKDQWFSTAVVKLMPPGSISGVVRDDEGEAMPLAYVRSFRRVSMSGRPRLVVAATT